jgi:hypothetical protein
MTVTCLVCCTSAGAKVGCVRPHGHLTCQARACGLQHQKALHAPVLQGMLLRGRLWQGRALCASAIMAQPAGYV